MPASSTSARSRASRPRSMTRSSRSTSRPPATRSRAAFAPMKEAGFGRIINVASAHGLVASPFKSAYVAAKHGVIGLTKTVALEGAEHGITCNAICPGYVWTPLVENQIDDTAKARGISREAGDPRRAARRPAEQALRRGRGAGRARRLPVRPRRPLDHRHRAARSTAAGRRTDARTCAARQQVARSVVIVGAGFGGLAAAKRLCRPGAVDVTHRRPAQPPPVPALAVPGGDRRPCRRRTSPRRSARSSSSARNVRVLLDEVTGVDADRKRGPARERPQPRLRLADPRDRRPPQLFRPRRMGGARARPQEHRGRDRDPPQGAARARAGRDRDRSGAAQGAADLRRHRRRPDRRRDGRRHRRARPPLGLARLPQHHPALLAGHPGRGRRPRAAGLPDSAVGEAPRSRSRELGVEVRLGAAGHATSASGYVQLRRRADLGATPSSGRPASRPRRPPNGSVPSTTAPAGSSSAPTCACRGYERIFAIGDTAALRRATDGRCPASRRSPSSRAHMSPTVDPRPPHAARSPTATSATSRRSADSRAVIDWRPSCS